MAEAATRPINLFLRATQWIHTSSHRVQLRQTTERNCAKLPNGTVPNYRMVIANVVKFCYNVSHMVEKYRKRVADELLADRLEGAGAVLVEGAKWCGKTTTCEQVAKSVLYMGDPDLKKRNIQLAEINVRQLLEGESPRLIDEWQEFPRFWDAVRFQVDHRAGFGHFILTGSSVPPDTDEISHSGTGRISRMTMRPMTLWESGESSGQVSLSALLNGEDLHEGECRLLDLQRVAYLVCRGGWPQAIGQREKIALMRAFDYYGAVVNSDISRVDKIPRAPERVMRLMRSYARLQGTQSNLSAIRLDMKEHDTRSLDEDTT